MRRTRLAMLVLATLALTGGGTAAAGERFEDVVGDVVGDAPDIVAVTVDEPGHGPLFSISVEFGQERPFGTDSETYTDVVFVGLGAAPDVDERGIMDDATTFTTGTHGVTLQSQVDQGAHLLTPERLYWQVVDVAVDGSVLTFTLDRQLTDIGLDLYFQVLAGVERGEEAEGSDEGDTYPELDQPPAHYRLGSSDW